MLKSTNTTREHKKHLNRLWLDHHTNTQTSKNWVEWMEWWVRREWSPHFCCDISSFDNRKQQEMTNIQLNRDKQGHQHKRTLSWSSMLAPLLSNNWTTLISLRLTANNKTVSPSKQQTNNCKQEKRSRKRQEEDRWQWKVDYPNK